LKSLLIIYNYHFYSRNIRLGKSDKWRNIIRDLVLLCFELNQSVSVIVNNSSPEGHIPMNLIDTLHLNKNVPNSLKNIVTPQMLLLCSWRTVKEVSQLFGLLGTEASIQTSASLDVLLTHEQVRYMQLHTHAHIRAREYNCAYACTCR